MTSQFAQRFLAVLVLAGAAAPAAAAQVTEELEPGQQAIVEQMVELNKKALAVHQSGRHAESQNLLGQALVLGETNGLESHDMTARTHVHLGIVAIAGLNRRDEGLRHFAEAQRIKPGIKLTKSLSTRTLEKEFRAARKLPAIAPVMATPAPEPADTDRGGGKDKEAKAEAASESSAEAKLDSEEPDVPVNVPQPLYCPTPIEGPPESDVKLHCLTQADVQARKIVVFYRPGNQERYTAVTMRPTKKGWFAAVIPGQKVTGRALQFYFEARGDAGRLAAANGKFDLPNEIVLKPGAARVGVGALAALSFEDTNRPTGEEETPLQVQTREDVRAAEEQSIARRAPGKLWVGLGLGTGWGWHLQLPLERHQSRQVTAGFSPGGLGQALPEIGFQVTRRLALSIQGRHQYLPTSGSGDPEAGKSAPEIAHAVLLRAQYAVAELGNLQLLGTAAAGYGSALRMKVNPAPMQGLVASDTVAAGPGVVGPGIGLAYNLTHQFILGIEARALAGLPNFGVMGEASAGVQYAF
jgi:hypothetical protein